MTPQLQPQFCAVAKPAPSKARLRRKPPRPISVRVTAEERAELEQEAGDQTLSNYVRSRLLGGSAARRKHHRRPDVDRIAIAKLLALLGQSELGPNLRAIVEDARSGTLELGDDLVLALERACAEIALMRYDLIRALGVKPE